MDFKQGTDIFLENGDKIGRLARVVIDPRSKKVTHLIVEKGFLFPEDRVIQIVQVASATEDRVTLVGSVQKDDFPPFEVAHFVEAGREEWGTSANYPSQAFIPSLYYYPPAGLVGQPALIPPPEGVTPLETERNIPDETVALKEGADVVSHDGRSVGSVEQVLTDADSQRATHFIISHGILFKDRKMVPIQWVDEIDEDRVYLSVGAQVLERLPAYEV